MTTGPHFDPVFPAHAIELCNATIVFDQPVPPKVLSGLQEQHKARLLASGLSEGPAARGFQFDVTTGTVVPLVSGGPVSYVTRDQGTTVTIVANQVNVQTNRYIRWAIFEGSINKLLMPLVLDFCKVVSVSGVQLNYWDRFMWSGSWADIDTKQLLNPTTDLIAPKAVTAAKQWHSHVGWFEAKGPDRQRLVNANIDVVSAAAPNMPPRPSIGIYTSIHESALPRPPNTTGSAIPEQGVIPTLSGLHTDLKALLRQIIRDSMAQRIGL